MSFKIKCKLQKSYVVLGYDEKMPRHFWRNAIVTGVLPSRDSEKVAIVRIKKVISIFKRPVNKFLPNEYTYDDTNQADKAREQKLR